MKRNSTGFIFVLIIAVLIIVVVLTTKPRSKILPLNNVTDNWTTYTSANQTIYGKNEFSFQYPDNLSNKTLHAYPFPPSLPILVYSVGEFFDVNEVPSVQPVKFVEGVDYPVAKNVPIKGFQYSVGDIFQSQFKSLNDFIDPRNGYAYDCDYHLLTINGYSSAWCDFDQHNRVYFIQSPGGEIIVTFVTATRDPEFLKTMEQILSTFKFTDEEK